MLVLACGTKDAIRENEVMFLEADNNTGFTPWRVRPHLVRPHELQVRQSPSRDSRKRNKQVLCGFVSSCAQCCHFFLGNRKINFKYLIAS